MAPSAVHVAMKVPSDLIERIERYRDHLQSLVGSGIVMTRAEAIRGLVSKALDQFESQQTPGPDAPLEVRPGATLEAAFERAKALEAGLGQVLAETGASVPADAEEAADVARPAAKKRGRARR